MTSPRGSQAAWASAYLKGVGGGLHALVSALRGANAPPDVRYQDERKSAAVTRDAGPMLYIGQQIVKRMGLMGYPSKIAEHYRSPERQTQLNNAKGRVTNAGAYASPHQYFEAVDIVHKTLNWDAPKEYWEALVIVVRVIEKELGVKLVHGHHWTMVDSAHVELRDWRMVRDRQLAKRGFNYVPTSAELTERWKDVLPSVKYEVAK